MRKRRLADLYVRGKDLEVNDGEGDPVKVRLQKLNEVDRDAVIRRAAAAKARFMIEADNEDSDLFQAMYGQIRELGEKDSLISVIIGDDVAKARQRIESQVSHNEETWGKDRYLQGLLDAWLGDENNPGLVSAQGEDPDDPEAKRVWSELERYEKEINDLVRHEIDALEADWTDRSEEAVWRDAAKAMLKRGSDEAFGREYERQQIFYAVRDPDDHGKRYFGTVAEVDDLDEKLRKYLIDQYNALIVDYGEGKDSRATPGSLDSSATPEETSQSSGQAAVSA